MRSNPVRIFLFIVLLCAVTVSVATIVGATGSYDVTSEGSVDVPDRTLSFSGQEFNIGSIGYVMPGDPIEAETDAPEGEDYTLYLFDNRATQIDQTQLTGNGSATFSTEGLEPGTYNLAVRADGEIKSVHPVVVSGYDAEVRLIGSLVPGESFTLAVELTKRAEGPSPDTITVVRGNDSRVAENVTATAIDGELRYEAELTAPTDEQDVELLTTVFGEESIALTSEQEILEFTQTTLTESVFNITTDADASTTSVTEGDTAEIVTTIENAGDFTGEKTVELRQGDTVIDRETVSLARSTATTVNLTYDTTGEATGEQDLTVATPDSTSTITLSITAEQGTGGPSGGTGTGGTGGSSGDSGESNDSETESQSENGTDENSTNTSSDTEMTNGTSDSDSNRSDSGSGADTGEDEAGSPSEDNGSTASNGTDDDVISPNDMTADESPLHGGPQFVVTLLVIAVFVRWRA